MELKLKLEEEEEEEEVEEEEEKVEEERKGGKRDIQGSNISQKTISSFECCLFMIVFTVHTLRHTCT